VGLGFSIPINNAKRSVDEFITSGSVNDGWLGVSLVDVDRETLNVLGLEGQRGALVAQVFLGSPGEKAGIRPGDFITNVDGREVRGVNSLTQMVGDIRPGERAAFTLIRDGASRDFEVRIETRTDQVAADNKKLWPGVLVLSLNDTIRSSLKLDGNAEGVYVYQVLSETPAAVVGVQRGDRITAVNDTPVKDIAAFYKVLREKTDKELWFTFVRGDATLESLKVKR
jgi:S1-C subfamily serine protease